MGHSYVVIGAEDFRSPDSAIVIWAYELCRVAESSGVEFESAEEWGAQIRGAPTGMIHLEFDEMSKSDRSAVCALLESRPFRDRIPSSELNANQVGGDGSWPEPFVELTGRLGEEIDALSRFVAQHLCADRYRSGV